MTHKRELFWPSLVGGLVALVQSFIFFFIAIHLKDIEFSGLKIGALFAVLHATTIVAAFPMGISNDYLTPRRMTVISLFFMGAALFGMAGIKNFLLYALAFLIYGLAQNLFRISLDVLMLKIFRGEGKGKSLALYNAIRMVGFGGGTLMGGLLVFSVGFEKTLVVIAALVLLCLLFAPKLPNYPARKATLAEYRADSLRPQVLFLFFWMAVFASHWGAEHTCYGLFLREGLDLSYAVMGVYMAVEIAVLTITVLYLGPRYDKGINAYLWLYVGLFTSGAGAILMTIPDFGVSLAFRSLHGVGDGILTIVVFLKISELFDPDRMGGNSGMFALAMLLGNAAGALVYGPMGQSMGYHVPMIVSGAVTILLILPIIAAPKSWRA